MSAPSVSPLETWTEKESSRPRTAATWQSSHLGTLGASQFAPSTSLRTLPSRQTGSSRCHPISCPAVFVLPGLFAGAIPQHR